MSEDKLMATATKFTHDLHTYIHMYMVEKDASGLHEHRHSGTIIHDPECEACAELAREIAIANSRECARLVAYGELYPITAHKQNHKNVLETKRDKLRTEAAKAKLDQTLEESRRIQAERNKPKPPFVQQDPPSELKHCTDGFVTFAGDVANNILGRNK